MVTIAIQSGGLSTRMGEEKGLVPFCGKPLIQNVLERVQRIGDEILIVSNKPDLYNFLNVKIVSDLYPNFGALAGLHSALFHAANEFVVNLACDIPYVNPNLIAHLLEQLKSHPEVDVVIPRTERGFEPMQAVYRKGRSLPAVETTIQQGKRKMVSWFELVTVMEIEEPILRTFNQKLENFLNMNTKEELKAAQEEWGCIPLEN
jgi:molybdopterin-guanine dinucleotide biosynthesis protein A